MADGDTIPGTKCSRCGSGLVAIMLDVGYAGRFCPECDLHEGWRDPMLVYRVSYSGEIIVNAKDPEEAKEAARGYLRHVHDLQIKDVRPEE